MGLALALPILPCYMIIVAALNAREYCRLWFCLYSGLQIHCRSVASRLL